MCEIRLYYNGGHTSIEIIFPDGHLRFDQKKASRVSYRGIYDSFDIHRDNTEWKIKLIQKFKQIYVQQWLSTWLIWIITTRKTWKNIQRIAQELSFKVQLHNVNSTIICVGDSFSVTNRQNVIFNNESLCMERHQKFQGLLTRSYFPRDIMMLILEMAFTQTVESSVCECDRRTRRTHFYCVRNKFFFGHFMEHEYNEIDG
jgi:hypothetical protein